MQRESHQCHHVCTLILDKLENLQNPVVAELIGLELTLIAPYIFRDRVFKNAQLIMYTYNLPLLARISQSRVLSTEPTILSSFTKEQSALDILTSIPMF